MLTENRFPQSLFIVLFAILTNQSGLAQSLIPEGSTPIKIADGFELSEGPYWHPDGYLLFSDVSRSIIYTWTQEDGVKPYISSSGQTNGITADLYGNIIVAQHSARRIGQVNPARRNISGLSETYNGARLHSPNDLVVKSDGAVFFTDPPWGGNTPEMDFHGVYRLPPHSKTPQLLVDSLSYPNGIAFSPDESKLYVAETNSSKIHVFDVVDDSTLANGRVFAIVNEYGNADQNSADGLKVDNQGNVWATGSEGVAIFSPEAELIDIINIPGSTTNVAFGGSDRLTLFITNFSALYQLDLGPLTLPEAPSDLQLEQSEHSLHLSWMASDDAIRNISVYRSKNQGEFEKIYAGPFTLSFRDSLIQPGETYSYKVTLTNSMGFESEFSNEVEITLTNTEEPANSTLTFKLHQNYPNPFNPTTTISYELENYERVMLKVYNMLGQEVATLVNKQFQTKGYYSVVWDAEAYPSGIYMYTLTTDFGQISHKLTLLK